ncbi:hypothetical protein QT17_01930 [Thermus sp. 2.9]|uniref:DNA ADP-ribosyl transferase n=2 Tax=Thermus TaxID=270 RepID=DART_THES0|nr:DUF4433 domain-containing protein [Thermus sp. 2.9]A0A0B0SG80.1 RecName: Full=DNA ADP-ribosyl transferase; Short=DarT; AltName: Full=Toxin DarT [Thermus sp. 2.9]KHG66095.1 hypothetical protein QT17_01930 [Thermus sp. 2.9]
MKRTYPEPTPIYHITHIDNLKGILRMGKLLAHNQSPPKQRSIAYAHIQERRNRAKVPQPPGGVLHDYVPFYFCPRSPMLYAIYSGATEYQGGQEPILHLVSSAQAVHKAGLPFVFTDRHGVLSHARFFRQLEELAQLDWEAIQASYWADPPELREKKQAEFLVYKAFPWALIEEIAVYSQRVGEEVLKILKQFPEARRPRVCIRKDWYY